MVLSKGSSAGRSSKRQKCEEMQKNLNAYKESAAENEDLQPVSEDETDRSLWGEMEVDAPRWNAGRRRSVRQSLHSNLAPLANALNPGSIPMPFQGAGQSELPDCPERPQSLPIRNRIPTPAWLPPVQGQVSTSNGMSPALSGLLDRDIDSPQQATSIEPHLLPVLPYFRPVPPPAQDTAGRDLQDELIHSRLEQYEQMEALENQLANVQEQIVNRATTAHAPPPSSSRPPLRSRRAGSGTSQMVADMMFELFSNENLGAPSRDRESTSGRLLEQIIALQEAIGSRASSSRLPAHLLYTDRDFNENDYEALLALDDTVQSRKGASQKEIDAVPTWIVEAGGQGLKEKRCPICLEDFEGGDVLRVMHCKHAFHLYCLDRWLTHKAVCPICQQSCNL